jgi:hypothetical protein
MTAPIDFAQWARNWQTMSQNLLAQGAGAVGTAPSGGDPRQWQAAQGEAMERLLAGAQGYLGMLQSLAAAAGGPGAMPPSVAWPGVFANSMGFAPSSPAAFANPMAQAMRAFAGNGGGLEQMMERFSASAAPMLNDAKGLLGLPAFGFLREHQENAQQAAQALIAYQEQTARYNRLLLKISEMGFSRFQSKLAEREEPGRQIDSVRGLYDLWIDAAEEAYAEIALSEEFRDVYGALVNAQMRVREHVQRQVERISSDLGIPTRSEVDSIGERLQALRREYREEREGDAERDSLGQEVAALRREVAALRQARAVEPTSNVVAFERAAAKSATAALVRETAPPRKRASASKAKSARQVVRSPSRAAVTTKAPSPKPRAKAAPPSAASAATPGFAARMARFARDNVAVAPVKSKTKSARR